MANKSRGYVEIELDKLRTLKFDLNAMAEIEDRLGVTFSKIGEIDMGVKQVRALLYAGLLHEDDELTEKQVGAMVDFENLKYASEKIAEALTLATGKN